MTLHRVMRLDGMLPKILDLEGRPRVPAALEDTAVITVPIYGTSQMEEGLADLTTGAPDATDIQSAATAAGKIRVVIAAEVLITGGSSPASMTLGLRWDRAGVQTSVALKTWEAPLTAVSYPLESKQRLYLWPTARLYATVDVVSVGRQLVLKIAYVELVLGEQFPT